MLQATSDLRQGWGNAIGSEHSGDAWADRSAPHIRAEPNLLHAGASVEAVAIASILIIQFSITTPITVYTYL
jgi:hypothetical protein